MKSPAHPNSRGSGGLNLHQVKKPIARTFPSKTGNPEPLPCLLPRPVPVHTTAKGYTVALEIGRTTGLQNFAVNYFKRGKHIGKNRLPLIG